MKKGFILISFLMAACLALTGCSSESEPFEAKSYTPDVPVRGIELDVRDRAVEVTISEDQHVHIEYSENSKEYYDIAVSEDSILTMTGASDKDLSDYMGGWDDYAIRTEIKKGESNLPESKEGGAKTLDVSANNGDIDIKFA